jgi:hypothetical protein
LLVLAELAGLKVLGHRIGGHQARQDLLEIQRRQLAILNPLQRRAGG